MTNLADLALGALSGGSPWAPIVAGVCGMATAAGPCAAPRAVALSALAAQGARLFYAGAFVVGLCACYATAGYLAASAGRASIPSSLDYELTALGLCIAGVYALLIDRRATKASASAGFALGALCASAASPCCTALIAPIAIAAAAAGRPAHAALLMACYALGHVLPVAAVAAWARMRRASNGLPAYLAALRTVAATVTLATGLYYAVLA